jgi:hypothetical protein
LAGTARNKYIINENMFEQALNTLVGLEAAPAKGGGFTYTHRDSGFVFEIVPIEESEDALMDGVQELAFNPIKMGLAFKVPHPSL